MHERERTREQIRQQASAQEQGCHHGDGDCHCQLCQARKHLGGAPLGAAGQAVGHQRVGGCIEGQEELWHGRGRRGAVWGLG